MVDGAHDAVVLTAPAWRRPEAWYTLATAIGLGQGRLNELISDKSEVVGLDLFERIADGLNMPDAARMMLGLAPAIARQAPSAGLAFSGPATHCCAQSRTAWMRR